MLANVLAARFALVSVLLTGSYALGPQYPEHCARAIVGDLDGVPYDLQDIELGPYVRNWDIILPPQICTHSRPYHVATAIRVCEYDLTPSLYLYGLDNTYVQRTGRLQYNAVVHTQVFCSDKLPTAESKKKREKEGYFTTMYKGHYGAAPAPVPVAHEADSKEEKPKPIYLQP